MRTAPRHRAGFTLLELLVVITIIVILAGASYGVYGIVNKNARIKITQSHLQLLKSALDRYEHDFSDFPPSDGDGLKGAVNLYACLTTVKKNGPYVQPSDLPTCETENSETVFADQWKQPIYYMHHHDYRNQAPNKHDFRLISPGPNKIYEEGAKTGDDIVNWNKDKPE